MHKKGFVEESLTSTILWIIFLILAGFGIYFLFKKLGLR
jgi:uncharacterized membrane protein